MRRPTALCLLLFFLDTQASYVPWLDTSEYCVQACGIIYSKVWFDSQIPLPLPCISKNAIKSFFYCAAKHCTAAEIEQGLEAANASCIARGPILPSYEAFRSDPKATPLANVTIVSTKDAKKKNFTEPVLPSDEWFDLAYRSTIVRERSFMFNFSFSFALYGYWVMVFLVGSLWRAKTELKTEFQPFLLRPLMSGGKHHMAATRAEAMAILGHLALAFIFCFVGYEDIAGNIYAPDHKLNLGKLISNRLGTVALAHIPLVWVFAARNNPLLWLMSWPYDAFSQFHRWIARMFAVIAVGHAIGYSIVRHKQGTYREMWSEAYWHYGVATITFVCTMVALSNFWFRRETYDTFLLVHIALAIVILPMLWMHFDILDDKGAFRGFLWPAIAIWILDRLLRIARLCYIHLGRTNSSSKPATISGRQGSELLRIEVTDLLPPLEVPVAGQHYFLYEPGRLKGYESHPFTLCSWFEETAEVGQANDKALEASIRETASDEVAQRQFVASRPSVVTKNVRHTFLIRPQDGFTRHLQNRLSAPSPHTRVEGDESIVVTRPLRLLLEGPYGHRPALAHLKSIVIFIGGSGITAAISQIYASLQAFSKPTIHLVWAVRKRATSDDVCSHELRSALAHSHFKLDLFLTDDPPRTADLEKTALPIEPSYKQFPGRPDVEAILQDEARQVNGKLAVFCCGPAGLEVSCRKAVANAMVVKKDISIHIERFGW
ncbi:Ferric/cupric reductase transmembrane component B [Pseudocercospora fuligena]|uniref:Ferric/cupric reductase transmembrane component B n=1 Tax=Pseudocercospora fuligena TaxID=685502 RepID=A0A8H6VLD9_9PEZI|nr:Ferric/cupric reductase transmembrane component B [Pseudocercospora fuligena]